MRLTTVMAAAAAAGLGLAPAAWAADLPAPMAATTAAAAPMAAPAPTWTSCYIGGNVGGGTSHNTTNDETPPHTPYGTLNSTAFVGGGQIGCDYQFAPHWVVGLQGLFDGSGFSASTTPTDPSNPLYPATLSGKIPWFATATARLGYLATPDLLLYAKGGFAWDHTDAKLTYAGTTIDSVGFEQTGWTAGGGVEWRFSPSWSAFAEYDYMGFGTKTVDFPNSNNKGDVHQDTQVGLIGINFHFGSGAY